MRCKCCNKILSDADTRRKNRFGQYEDMCIGCLKLSYVPLDEEEQENEDEDYPDVDWNNRADD